MGRLLNLDIANAYIAIAEEEKNFESAGKRHRRNYVIRLAYCKNINPIPIHQAAFLYDFKSPPRRF